MLLEGALRLLVSVVGAFLHAFIAMLILRKPRSPSTVERAGLVTLLASGLWYAGTAAALFQMANIGDASRGLIGLFEQIAAAGLAVAAPSLLQVALLTFGWRAIPSLSAYIVLPVTIWASRSGAAAIFEAAVTITILVSATVFIAAGVQRKARHERRFLLTFATALLAASAAAHSAGPKSALFAAASLLPALTAAFFIYHYGLFQLFIGRRIVFALTLGAICAIYLFVVRRLAGFLEDEFEAFGPLTELALISAAALIWIPLYGWITHFFTKRTQVYVDFSKRLIEDAARILNHADRIQYLAEELGRSFKLGRVLIATAGPPRTMGTYGAAPPAWAMKMLDGVEEELGRKPIEVIGPHKRFGRELYGAIQQLGFNHLFSLRYEQRLVGMLFIDTSPLPYLDENEAILLALSRQISHSIETCRIIEEKIGLETTIVRQEHLADLGRLAASVAHEIKNPLSSINTLVHLMTEDGVVKSKYGRDLSYITAEVDRLARSVHQLLNYSRPAPELLEEVDLSALLEETCDVVARQAAGESVRVAWQVEPGLRIGNSSAALIKQIVLNLLGNATQASGSGDEVRIEARRISEDAVMFSVADNGPGVAIENQARIFEPFFTTKQKGTGLGLAIVKKDVRLLGGEIEVESPVDGAGRGTRFVVRFRSR